MIINNKKKILSYVVVIDNQDKILLPIMLIGN